MSSLHYDKTTGVRLRRVHYGHGAALRIFYVVEDTCTGESLARETDYRQAKTYYDELVQDLKLDESRYR